VIEEFFADLFGTRVVLEVVVSLGEGESASRDVEDDLFRVLGVVVGEEAVGGDVGEVAIGEEGVEVFGGGKGVDTGQVGRKRLGSEGVDGGAIRAGGVKVADFAEVGAGSGFGVGGRAFENGVELFLRGFTKDGGGSPGRESGRDGVFVEPASVGVAPEVLAGFAFGIERRAIDSGLRG